MTTISVNDSLGFELKQPSYSTEYSDDKNQLKFSIVHGDRDLTFKRICNINDLLIKINSQENINVDTIEEWLQQAIENNNEITKGYRPNFFNRFFCKSHAEKALTDCLTIIQPYKRFNSQQANNNHYLTHKHNSS